MGFRKEKVTCYVTSDDEYFFDEKEAIRHEEKYGKLKEAEEMLSKYRIEDPQNRFRILGFLHGDTPRLKDMGYQWYAVSDEGEAKDVYDAFLKIGVRLFRYPVRYPSVFGYDPDRHSQFWLDDLEKHASQSADFVREISEAMSEAIESRKDWQEGAGADGL